MKWTESVCHRPVDVGVLRSIHASDQEMYPAALPFERLQGWVDSASWLSIEFVVNATPIGVVVALPVQRTKWEALLSGGLKETDIEASRDFGQAVQGSDEGQDPVGIHIFHVERYESPQAQNAVQFRGFGNYAVGAVLDAARAEGYTILGTSALTATEDGHRAFGRMGFRSTGYEEVWIDGEAPRSGTQDTPLDDGRQVSRARMMRRDEAAELGDA
ncbi:hypothetical protein F5X68DRAFT_264399 [Plectosphaerella plurivora]|uniref:N-acetyltransferase domain-containing protein n=1 Tax=Plectosphaerella plurivora TaxID=936078 RepID=A0A9P8V4V1_9PEZI|nr:hypothetical protein F5X68DRAFT_264399 [Plectosphaerella plurivora]